MSIGKLIVFAGAASWFSGNSINPQFTLAGRSLMKSMQSASVITGDDAWACGIDENSSVVNAINRSNKEFRCGSYTEQKFSELLHRRITLSGRLFKSYPLSPLLSLHGVAAFQYNLNIAATLSIGTLDLSVNQEVNQVV